MRPFHVHPPRQGCHVHYRGLPASDICYHSRRPHHFLHCEHYAASGIRLQRPGLSLKSSMVSHQRLRSASLCELEFSMSTGQGIVRGYLRDEVWLNQPLLPRNESDW